MHTLVKTTSLHVQVRGIGTHVIHAFCKVCDTEGLDLRRLHMPPMVCRPVPIALESRLEAGPVCNIHSYHMTATEIATCNALDTLS